MLTNVRRYTGTNTMASRLHTIVSFLGRRPGLCLVVCIGLFVIYAVVHSLVASVGVSEEQTVVDYIANNLLIHIQVVDNLSSGGTLSVILTNGGFQAISPGDWRIYLNCFGTFTTLTTAGFSLNWVNGGLFYLEPVKEKFHGIPAGKSVTLTLNGWASISRTDFLPNWYVWSPTGMVSPAVIEVTKDETLSFVGAFNDSSKWKRNQNDMYNPYTPEQRFQMHLEGQQRSMPIKQLNVIPTPKLVNISEGKQLVIDNTWVVVRFVDTEQESRSYLLTQKLGLQESDSVPSSGKFFEFVINPKLNNEEYIIQFHSHSKKVTISSSNSAGAFYAIQTLFMIIGYRGNLNPESFPEIFIQDKPRFEYRGMMLDVARNFHPKETIFKLLDVMSMYKMNKLHMHLSDDEGWRLEIPDIPELIKYGSKRCHDVDKCIKPSLGSGPFTTSSGSGFYSVSDFREILRYAVKRHIQVIPEIDMPGHALAAVFSMAQRDKKRNENDSQQSSKTESYLLADGESNVRSVQGWSSNAMNPCLNTTYLFVDRLVSAIKSIYYNIQTLDVIHFGGDEVPPGIWSESQSCKRLFQGSEPNHVTIKKMFMFTVGDIAVKHGLNIALWEDGAFGNGQPFDITGFKPDRVYINTWNNAWNNGGAQFPIAFSDAGYKVIISMATHLYFDHPYEPDPEERGLYWATRYVDTYKTFGTMPMDVYSNADFDRNGNKVDLTRICPNGKCPRITSPENIVGMQACVWSELIRNEDQLFSMVFPRALAAAERAWHKSDWEDIQDGTMRERTKKEEWAHFVQVLGNTHLPMLDRIGVKYRITPPGVLLNSVKNTIEFNTFYPNHPIMLSLGNDIWHRGKSDVPIPKGKTVIRVKSISPVLERESRIVSMTVDSSHANMASLSSHVIACYLLCSLAANVILL